MRILSAALSLACLVGAPASGYAHTKRRGRVVGSVTACAPGVGLLARMEVAAVNSHHRVVKTADVQGEHYSLTVAPGKYMLKLESNRVISRRSATVVAGRTKRVNFIVGHCALP